MKEYNGLTLSKFMYVQGRDYRGYYGEVNYNGNPIAAVEDDGYHCQTFVTFYKPEYKQIWKGIKDKFHQETEPERRGIDDWKLVEHLIQIYQNNVEEPIPSGWGHSKI